MKPGLEYGRQAAINVPLITQHNNVISIIISLFLTVNESENYTNSTLTT